MWHNRHDYGGCDLDVTGLVARVAGIVACVSFIEAGVAVMTT